MLKLFIIKPHWFNKISKSANGNYKNDDSVTRNVKKWRRRGGGGGSEIFSTTKEGAPKKLNR